MANINEANVLPPPVGTVRLNNPGFHAEASTQCASISRRRRLTSVLSLDNRSKCDSRIGNNLLSSAQVFRLRLLRESRNSSVARKSASTNAEKSIRVRNE